MRPSSTCLLPPSLGLLWGIKEPSEAHFLSTESQFLLVIPRKTISFPLPLFCSDNAIFQDKDNISIFYKKLKICRISGYLTEYNILFFFLFKNTINPSLHMFFEVFSLIFCINLYNYACFSQIFCNFGGEFCASCAEFSLVMLVSDWVSNR